MNSPSKKKKLPPVSTGWRIFWIIITFFTLLEGILLNIGLMQNPRLYQPFAIIFLILSLSSFLISMKLIPNGFSQAKQAMCHMGRVKTKTGYQNTKAMIFFMLYGNFESILLLMMGNLIEKFGTPTNNLRWVQPVAYFTAICCMYTCCIPIDRYYKGHVGSAFLVFSFSNFLIHYLIIYLIMENSLSWYLFILWGLMSIFSGLYVWGYINDYPFAAAFQKSWLLIANTIFAMLILKFYSISNF